MKKTYDVIVLGLGGLGSAALYWLARRSGKRVLGLEQFTLGHPYGSSQDHSRIIRLAYDDPAYAALMPYAYASWHEVEAEAGLQLVFETGGVIFGPASTGEPTRVESYAATMESTGIPFEWLSAAEAMRRFPQFRLREDEQVLYQAQAGLVDPGKANAVHTSLARRRGADMLAETPVRRIRPLTDSVEVETAAGTFSAQRLVIASGAWTDKILEGTGIQLPLTVTEEQVTYFATPHLKEFSMQRFPVWIWHGEYCFYGFPIYGEVATKAGQDVGGDPVTVDTRKFAPNPLPLERLTRFLEERLPRFLGPVLYTKPCLYTLPPDQGFILDTLPGYPQVSLVIGSNHSFKFASLIGRILSDLALDGRTPYSIHAFRLDRPAITDPNYPSNIKLWNQR